MERVISAMHEEMELEASFLNERALRSIYFGGGTPSLLTAEQITAFIDHATTLFDCSKLEECTLEANPDDLTSTYLQQISATRINRLSVGIQSFDDDELRLMNRRHTAQVARDAIHYAQQIGFENISIDLIFGVPGFGIETLRHSLHEALQLNVQHISAYHLTVEPETAFGRQLARGKFHPIAEEQSEREFQLVHHTLTEAGYNHYEVSNFAQPQRRAIHNSAYWHNEPYLGIGPAAHSYNGKNRRRWSVASISNYLNLTTRYEEEYLTPTDRVNERLLTGLRTTEGVELHSLQADFGKTVVAQIITAAQPWLSTGQLQWAQDRLFIPAEHFLLSDAIITALFLTDDV